MAELLDDNGQPFAEVDVTDEASVRAWIEHGVAEFGGIDILYNNAGSVQFGAIDEQSFSEELASHLAARRGRRRWAAEGALLHPALPVMRLRPLLAALPERERLLQAR